MRKLMFMVAVFAALFVTVISGDKNQYVMAQTARQSMIAGADNVPEDVRKVAKDIYVEWKKNVDEKEMYLKDVYFEGKTLVCEFVVEEVLLDGRTMKQDLLKDFSSEEEFVKMIHDQMIPRNKNQAKRLRYDPLRKNHYNLMYRYVGSRSGEQIDVVVKYNELPKE